MFIDDVSVYSMYTYIDIYMYVYIKNNGGSCGNYLFKCIISCTMNCCSCVHKLILGLVGLEGMEVFQLLSYSNR